MKNNAIILKSIIVMITAFGALALMSGCGGGGGGSSVNAGSSIAPTAPPAVRSGNGRAAFDLHFRSRSAGRDAGAAATGTVAITVTITGYYSENDNAFSPITASLEIPASGGHGTASIIDVPTGVNHLMTAVATWPDGATDTIKYIIPEIREGELTQGAADSRTTVIADAALALADRDKIKLSKVTQGRIDTLAAAVDAFHAAGFDYADMKIADVLDYETRGNVLSSIEVRPASATVAVGASTQFTATAKNAYGMALAGAVAWSVTGGVGTISSGGLFTATAEGSGAAVAASGTVSGSATVTVTNPATPPVCGNGVVETGEMCDDGNAVTEACAYGQHSCTVCNSSCQSAAGAASYCGDSATDTVNGETCDDGNTMTEACTYGQHSCTVCDSACHGVAGLTSYCGDFATDTVNGEVCDDGNAVTEACAYGQTSCTVCNSSCQSAAGAASYCGDSATDTVNGETCDEGTSNGQPNQCNSTCNGTTASVCGNGVVESGETCDDGNTVTEACAYGQTSCTVCDSSCQSAAGAASYCGDSLTDTANGETCDDGANNGQPGFCGSPCNRAVPSVTSTITDNNSRVYTNIVLSSDMTKLFATDYYSGLIVIYDFNQGKFAGLAQNNPLSFYLEKDPLRNVAYTLTVDTCGVYASDEPSCANMAGCQWNATDLKCELIPNQTFQCNFDGVCDSGEVLPWCEADCGGSLPRRAGGKSNKEAGREARGSAPVDIMFYMNKIDLDTGALAVSTPMDLATPGSGYLFSKSRDAMYYLALVGDDVNTTGELRRIGLGTFTQTLSAPTTRLSFSSVIGMAIDDASGTLYVPDENDSQIYKYNLDTLAETGASGISFSGATLYDLSAHRHADGNSYMYAVRSDGFFVYDNGTGAQSCSYPAISHARDSQSGANTIGVYEPYHHVYVYDGNTASLLVLDATNCSVIANLGDINLTGFAYNALTRTVYMVDGSANIYVVQYQEGLD